MSKRRGTQHRRRGNHCGVHPSAHDLAQAMLDDPKVRCLGDSSVPHDQHEPCDDPVWAFIMCAVGDDLGRFMFDRPTVQFGPTCQRHAGINFGYVVAHEPVVVQLEDLQGTLKLFHARENGWSPMCADLDVVVVYAQHAPG